MYPIVSLGSRTAFPKISRSTIEPAKELLPESFDEQKNISSVLNARDPEIDQHCHK